MATTLATPVLAEQDAERCARNLAPVRLLLERRCLVEPATDQVAEHDHDGAEEEGDAPSPREKLVLGQDRGKRQEHRRSEHLPALGAAECEAGEEPAAVVGGVLEGHGVGAGLLTGGREALEQAEDDEEDGREDTDL
jgi:hypothetical protein